MSLVSFLFPATTRERLHELASRRTKSAVMIDLIKTYDGTPLHADKASASGFDLPEDAVAALDLIKDRNNLKSRNQAISLLIDLAWEREQERKHVRLKSHDYAHVVDTAKDENS